MANISVTVQDGNNITLVTTPTPTQVITIDRGIAGPAGPAGVPAGSQYQIQYNSGVSTFAASPNLTFTGTALVLSTSTASDAFRITQTGAGNAFVVEDSTNPDATPFVINSSGVVLIARPTASVIANGALQINVQSASFPAVMTNTGATAYRPHWTLTVADTEVAAIGTAQGALSFYMGGLSKMQLDSAGRLNLGTTIALAAGIKNYWNPTGSTTAYGEIIGGTIQADVTSAVGLVTTIASTAAAAFTLGNLRHFFATSGTFGAGSAVTNQFGFFANSDLTGATNNYGFYSTIAAATGRFNFYAQGTAINYFAGDVGIGTNAPSSELHLARNEATAYDGAATDGQLTAGATFFVQQTGGVNTGVSQIVFQSRSTFPYNRIVSSGGSIPFMTFVTNNAERMRISSAGDVGIGTTSPSAKLHVSGTSTTAEIRVQSNSTAPAISFYADNPTAATRNWAIAGSFNAFGDLVFQQSNVLGGNPLTAGTTRMTLDASGNLGLGVTPSAWATTSNSKAIQFGRSGSLFYSTDNAQAVFGNNYCQTGANSFTYLTNGYAQRYAQSDFGGAHIWLNAPSGTAGAAITFTQAMTLDASGNLLVGTTSASPSDSNSFLYNVSGKAAVFNHATGTGSGQQYIGFTYAGTYIGSISQNGTTGVLYNINSDYRLKNITGPITTSGAYIDSLKPVEGTWKADGSTFVGLIAHETQEVSRTTVATGTKDGEEIQGMDYSSSEIIANLIAEIQSLRKRVSALEPTPFASYEQFGIPKP